MKLGYHRVSSAQQSLEIGRSALLDAGVEEMYLFEEKESGKGTKNRPQLKALLNDYQNFFEECLIRHPYLL